MGHSAEHVVGHLAGPRLHDISPTSRPGVKVGDIQRAWNSALVTKSSGRENPHWPISTPDIQSLTPQVRSRYEAY